MYHWKTTLLEDNGSRFKSFGWNVGLVPTVGVEYYLRPKVALDVGLRYHLTNVPPIGADTGGNLRFFTLWIGHYVRF